jgi:hypothetical protein
MVYQCCEGSDSRIIATALSLFSLPSQTVYKAVHDLNVCGYDVVIEI